MICFRYHFITNFPHNNLIKKKMLFLDTAINKYTDSSSNKFYDLVDGKYVEVKWNNNENTWLKKDETTGKYYDDNNWYDYDGINDEFIISMQDDKSEYSKRYDDNENDYDPQYFSNKYNYNYNNNNYNMSDGINSHNNNFGQSRHWQQSLMPDYNQFTCYNNYCTSASPNHSWRNKPKSLLPKIHDVFDTKIELKLGQLKPILDEIYKIQQNMSY